ncbi:uncharacterized protein [Physcomitrium patens]|uniref:uncharacterized protein isoform X2 n=1 Tax=Physcomitrium patens TaxID=3218 RepID=UPI000D16C7FF|nr:227 kDa spindle- and centromere-associated protein-like isoform X2 [Physcomitrium patens]|eukprot:XP_024372450.1 227 kDa spindle- and centromere-associated protein-like isoform X2 [Physcomitrella patens]
MDRDEGDAAMCIPAEVDKYIQESVSHLLEPCSCQDYWEVKFAEAVDSQRQLQEQVYILLHRLEEANMRCTKSREEAALNAQALKRQISETQRLAAECKSLTLDCEALTQECARLERECNLYHNDREVFMEVADEAEERATQAEERADEANRRLEELLEELQNIRSCTAVVHPLPTENADEEDAAILRLKIADLESQLQKLQVEAETVRSCADIENNKAYDLLREENSRLEILLSESNQRYEETSVDLDRIRELCTKMENARDEMSVSNMITSAISAGVIRAVEQEREEAISTLNLQFKAILKRMQGEFRSSRERLLKKWNESEGGRERTKLAEKSMKSLLMEADALRREVAICRDNLDKSQEQIHLLSEENRELRLLLKVKCNSCLGYTASPFGSRGNSFMKSEKLQDELAGDVIMNLPPGAVGAARSPFTPLRMNYIHTKPLHA